MDRISQMHEKKNMDLLLNILIAKQDRVQNIMAITSTNKMTSLLFELGDNFFRMGSAFVIITSPPEQLTVVNINTDIQNGHKKSHAISLNESLSKLIEISHFRCIEN